MVPPPFQEIYGKYITERSYDCYGMFGGYDVYDLVALWNRDSVSVESLGEKPTIDRFGGLYPFEKENLKKQGLSDEEIEAKDLAQKQEYLERALARYKNQLKMLEDFKHGKPDETMVETYGDDYLRIIGIDIACDDEQNATLMFPIKITSKPMDYDDAKASKSDPYQGL